MKISPTSLQGVVICQPAIFRDSRGFFLESWNQRNFAKSVGSDVSFVQDNRSHSMQDVLRGLHYQTEPMAQGKLVGVSRGRIYDVCVDLRRSSPTFGQTFGCYLDETDAREIWIPPGLAHGFLVVSAAADVWYKTTQFYSPQHERCIRWDDEHLAIDWPLSGKSPLVSDKDRAGSSFAKATFFA
jgi:dTDP-4-dehydrorhamnose 3,5-epimerase